MKTLKNSLVLLILLACTLAAETRYAGSVLELGVGARALALGEAAVTLYGDVSNFYFNPAAVAYIDKPVVNLMYAPTFGGFSSPLAHFNYIGVAMPLPRGAIIAVNWTRFAVDDIPIYSSLGGTSFYDRLQNPQLRPDGTPQGYFKDTEDVYYFTFAKLFQTEIPLGWLFIDLPVEFPVGINFKMIRQSLHSSSASGMGVDAGFMAKINLGTFLDSRLLGDLMLGYSVTDLTRTTLLWNTRHEDRIERSQRIGLSYQQVLRNNKADIKFYYTLWEKYDVEHLFGAELSLYSAALRIGKNRAGLTAGAGIKLWRLNVDYAFVSFELDNSHRISCGFSF